jgi:hypothetical protein
VNKQQICVGGSNKTKVQNTYSCIRHLELVDNTLKEKTPTPKTRQTMKQFLKTIQYIRRFYNFSPSFDAFDAPTITTFE